MLVSTYVCNQKPRGVNEVGFFSRKMGPPIYYVVRVISNNESIVVPDLWITNGMCLWPKSNPEDKAKNRIFKPDWPQRGPVVLTSAHRK